MTGLAAAWQATVLSVAWFFRVLRQHHNTRLCRRVMDGEQGKEFGV